MAKKYKKKKVKKKEVKPKIIVKKAVSRKSLFHRIVGIFTSPSSTIQDICKDPDLEGPIFIAITFTLLNLAQVLVINSKIFSTEGVSFPPGLESLRWTMFLQAIIEPWSTWALMGFGCLLLVKLYGLKGSSSTFLIPVGYGAVVYLMARVVTILIALQVSPLVLTTGMTQPEITNAILLWHSTYRRHFLMIRVIYGSFGVWHSFISAVSTRAVFAAEISHVRLFCGVMATMVFFFNTFVYFSPAVTPWGY